MTQTHISNQQGALPENILMTVEEFFDRYTDQPAEIVNGEVLLMSPNTRPPMDVAGPLYASLLSYTRQGSLGKVTIETAFVLDADERTDWVHHARQPDVAFVAQERIGPHNEKFGKAGPWRLAPDLAVEVISPTDRYSDITQKIGDYLRYGVRVIILIDPQTQTVRVITSDNPDGRTLHEGDVLSGDPVLPGWSMPVAELFAGL